MSLQCMSNRSTFRSCDTIISRKRIKLARFWSILPKAELQYAGIHFETVKEMTYDDRLAVFTQ